MFGRIISQDESSLSILTALINMFLVHCNINITLIITFAIGKPIVHLFKSLAE